MIQWLIILRSRCIKTTINLTIHWQFKISVLSFGFGYVNYPEKWYSQESNIQMNTFQIMPEHFVFAVLVSVEIKIKLMMQCCQI